ncbi:hypothetical protein GGR58DRAFT_468289 [Xylaria digitata]|nr:hypothetical protein GGR58DRAFT_468289 [Xylaria digitata]
MVLPWRSSFIIRLLFANLPQLLLSLGYFAHDVLFAQIVNGLKWNSYIVQLRV